jgi:uncharacterized membrane protein YkoI
MSRFATTAALVLITALSMGIGRAGATNQTHKAPVPAAKTDSALASEAKITMNAAKATALARVPGGKVKSSELEREKGKLIYSFDIEVKGKPGIEEVHVDAITGKVLSMGHEGSKAESKEAKQEKAEAHPDSAKAQKAPAKH